jgi:hypothetical protein
MEEGTMKCELSRKKPAWWLQYAIGLLMLGLLALVEMSVPAGGLRGVLQIAVAIAMFRLMAIWVRHNRVAIDLEGWNALPRPQEPTIGPRADDIRTARRPAASTTRR